MSEAEERRKRLGRLLRATAKSPYLSWIAKDAGLDASAAKKILESTAETLDPASASAKATADKRPQTQTSNLKPQTSRMVLNTDGASRGNPGEGGAGAYLTMPDGTVVGAYKKYLGHVTNNYAEYSALILGLDEAAKAGASELEVRSDSELMVRQLTGVYKVKHPDIKQLVEIVRHKERGFSRVYYRHIPREQNMIADRLSNEAIDEAE